MVALNRERYGYKQRYRTWAEANIVAERVWQQMGGEHMWAYSCLCGGYHVGHRHNKQPNPSSTRAINR